ncbi:2-polyprenyl-3-methyl-6-methoxy-1,4-benzoquinone monooxygenase [Zoogloea sp. LCSB751]|uniref:2-polyprenyl-3-methyl-6-methoxy-1,4-benzoquinone monooxygenase n=1 Tax=Zoogloea sp. LCSB751 TaxID=1965277 RepID=UPI0009A51F49|nr:2-polyprenyl-3-methyl-6-methoxy-1,4-benzoquinone monooxygenase [Zoogloea sp. LCSB751]
MLDQLIIGFDKALRTVFADAYTVRPVPGETLPEADMSDQEKRHAASLMRVNHCGEICAQALYQGQALMSQNEGIKKALAGAAHEETEHLAWTERRIAELGGRKSFLNPVWYSGSLAIGMLAARFGDGVNLGFLAETERQVEAHLDSHLGRLPEQDLRSREIVTQMKVDEVAHADTAVRLGAVELPTPVKAAMKATSKLMTGVAYWL